MRAPESMNGLLDDTMGFTSMQDIYLRNFNNNPDKEFLGKRAVDKKGVMLDHFVYETNAQVKEQATNLGSGLLKLDLVPVREEFEDYSMRLVAIYSSNSVEYIKLDVRIKNYRNLLNKNLNRLLLLFMVYQ